MATCKLYIDSYSGIGLNDGQSFTIGSKNHQVILNKLKYIKKVYQPGEILAVVTVKAKESKLPTYSDLQTCFLKKYVKMKFDDDVVADNYFVYSIKPVYDKQSSSTSLDVELGIYSLDKLMTLDKYNRAHTGKTLGAGIFLGEAAYYKISDLSFPSSVTSIIGTTIPVVSSPQLLSYTSSVKKDNADNFITDELRIPYAVQYEETFYDFMVRTANRYGEFLYFENGKLHLGIDLRESNYKKTDGSIIDWATRDNAVSLRYYESLCPSVISVTDKAYSYMDRKDSDTAVYASDTGFYRNSPLAIDAYLAVIEKDGFSSMEKKYKEWQKIIISVVYDALKATTLAKVITNIVTDLGWQAINNAMAVKNENDKNNKENITPWEKKETKEVGDQWSSPKLSQFSTQSGSKEMGTNIGNANLTNFTSSFYPYIRKIEEKLSSEAVTLDFNTNYFPLMLGDKIYVDGTDYVVIQVEGTVAQSQSNLKVKAIPLYSVGTNQSVAIPPVAPVAPVRFAKPQTAFVAGKLDPDKLCRVRILYHWQNKDEEPSPWIRVAQAGATNGGGIHYKPEDKDEVILEYEDGNVERPFVAGYMLTSYSTQNWPSSIPDRGITSKNGHSLSFKDPVDGLNFFLGFFPGLSLLKSLIPAADLDAIRVKDEKWRDLTGGFTLSDRYGLYKISGSSDGRAVSIASPMGNVSINAFTGITISAPNGDVKIEGKNVSISATNKLSITSGTSVTSKYLAKADKIVMDVFEGVVNNVLTKVIDLSFIRTVLEVALRPVDGTLKIKTTTFLCLEAGKGSTEIPAASYAKKTEASIARTDTAYTAMTTDHTKLKNTIPHIKEVVDTLVNGFSEAFEAWQRAEEAYRKLTGESAINAGEAVISHDTIKGKVNANVESNTLSIVEGDLNLNYISVKQLDPLPDNFSEAKPKEADFDGDPLHYRLALLSWENRSRNYETQKRQRQNLINKRAQNKAKIIDVCTTLLRAMNDFKRAGESFNHYEVVYANNPLGVFHISADICAALDFEYDIKRSYADELRSDMGTVSVNWEAQKQIMYRKVAFGVLKEHFTGAGDYKIAGLSKPDFTSAEAWKKFVSGIKVNDTKTFKDWGTDMLKKAFKFDEWKAFASRNPWKPNAKGKILFSDDASKTYSLNGNTVQEETNKEYLTKHYDIPIKAILETL